jgi:4'-phosphopantetheinyl transferase
VEQRAASGRPALATVWLARLAGPSVTDLLLLSTDELDRAQRLGGDRVRGRWVASRAFLRRRLAEIVGADPADLRFELEPAGKPRLPEGPHFSLSHSGDWAVLAVCAAAPVGADIEEVRPELAAPPSAERWFSERERAQLATLAGADRTRRFFELWTFKEAYLKAKGESMRPESLGEVPAGGWVVERPPVPPGYCAAVVVLAEQAVFSFR